MWYIGATQKILYSPRLTETMEDGRLKDMDRRDFLKLLGVGGVGVGSYKAVDNVLLGYGTNLKNQDLSKLASDGLSVASDYSVYVNGYTVSVDGWDVAVGDGSETLDSLSYLTASREEAMVLDSRYGLEGVVEEIVTDAPRIGDDEYTFEFHNFEDFFDRISSAKTCPFTTDLLRGFGSADREDVAEFVDASPENPKRVLESMESSFVEKSSYDLPRYIAGSITDNIFFKRIRLRPYFEGDVGYESLNSDSPTRMFCYEYVYRSIEALHSVPAHRQEHPVVGFGVHDSRHKHYYTGVASVVEKDGELVIPVTFVDYTRTTLYQDLRLSGILGSSLNAYDSDHRATRIDWD